MVAFENLLVHFIELMKITDIFGSLGIEWNKKKSCFSLKPKRKQLIIKMRLIELAVFAFLVILQILWTWNNKNTYANIHSIFHICALLLFPYTHYVFWTNADSIVSYLNGMLLFEKIKAGKYLNYLECKI